MRIFSYRNKRTLRRIALIALLAAVLLGLLILARISYLGRYVVYSPDGVYFDKTQKLQRTRRRCRTHPTQRSIRLKQSCPPLPRRQT